MFFYDPLSIFLEELEFACVENKLLLLFKFDNVLLLNSC